jgi:hypothetical protein
MQIVYIVLSFVLVKTLQCRLHSSGDLVQICVPCHGFYGYGEFTNIIDNNDNVLKKITGTI